MKTSNPSHTPEIKPSHTPEHGEPWWIGARPGYIGSGSGDDAHTVAIMQVRACHQNEALGEALAEHAKMLDRTERAIACVNALAGIADPAKELARLREVSGTALKANVAVIEQEIAKLREENARLTETMEVAASMVAHPDGELERFRRALTDACTALNNIALNRAENEKIGSKLIPSDNIADAADDARAALTGAAQTRQAANRDRTRTLQESSPQGEALRVDSLCAPCHGVGERKALPHLIHEHRT